VSGSLIQMRAVRKTFPGVVALRDCDFDVGFGEVRALVGENGAGKSTLIKILAGALVHDAGTVNIGGVPIERPTPALAARLGVSVIHQDRQIAPDISVAENVLLGRLPHRMFGPIDWRKAHRQARALLETVGLNIDVRRPANQLNLAQQQELELARALVGDAKVVIMDEPTASLTGGEIERLFAIVRSLRAAGQSVLYISHHLEEVFEIAETVTVMRDGQIVGTDRVESLDANRLTRLMFGRDVKRPGSRKARSSAEEGRPAVLEVHGLCVRGALYGADLVLRKGEILGVTGGIGSGRRELARCLVGALYPDAGDVTVAGRVIRSPGQALRRGVGFVPEDRKRDGVLPDLDLVENVDLARVAMRAPAVVRHGRRRTRVLALAQRLRIRFTRASAPITQLSGGNQQKALLARLLNVDARILVFDEPTAGVDVGTRLELYEVLRDLVAQGASVLVFSSDNEEIKLLVDRVIVLSRGRVAGELSAREITKERLLALETEA